MQCKFCKRDMECKFCKREMSRNGIRLGACWDCAEAERILDEGLDMNDKGPAGVAAASGAILGA